MYIFMTIAHIKWNLKMKGLYELQTKVSRIEISVPFQVYLSHSDNTVFYEHGNIFWFTPTGNINCLILILRAAFKLKHDGW